MMGPHCVCHGLQGEVMACLGADITSRGIAMVVVLRASCHSHGEHWKFHGSYHGSAWRWYRLAMARRGTSWPFMGSHEPSLSFKAMLRGFFGHQ